MLLRETRKLALFIGSVVALLFLAIQFLGSSDDANSTPIFPLKPLNAQDSPKDRPQENAASPDIADLANPEEGNATPPAPDAPAPGPPGAPDPPAVDIHETHNEIFSVSTNDRKFFRISFGDENAMNPNIIPHPNLDNSWIIVAQRLNKEGTELTQFAELVCYASFGVDDNNHDVLRCEHPPGTLPIEPTSGTMCDGELSLLNFNSGPHDGRIFQGPKGPYTIYGSNSRFTCFGQFIQDLKVLMGWVTKEDTSDAESSNNNDESAPSPGSVFAKGTELQRSVGPYSPLEKNWFIFWDQSGQMYVHYDVFPKRSFARLSPDGSVSEDLAPLAEPHDESCMARFMPRPGPELESVHQATNTLAVTMCKRADPGCLATESNTFLFTIFHHKSHHGYHSEYEPYLMLFRQEAPFEVHAISKKPIWIHGRTGADPAGMKKSDMFYLVSTSWKSREQKYHGYLDDVLFIAIGIEDKETAGIDVVAGDLLAELGFCSDV